VQAILAGQTEGSLDSTSHLADRTCEVTPLPTTASISPSTADNPARLLKQIEELSCQVASLQASKTDRRSQSRDRHCPHSRYRFSSTPDNTVQPHDICWYHWKFGDEPESAPHCAPTSRGSTTKRGTPASRETPDSRETPYSRKTPPADINGG